MPDQAYPMVGECTDRYEAVRQADGGVFIQISVPPRFADLWLVKLTGLTTTDAEIAEYEPPAPGPGMMNQELRFRLQTALLGEVGPALRGVAYRLEVREVCIRFYFHGPVGDEDRESASCVVTEVIAGLPEDVRVTEEVIRLDAPARIPRDLPLVFHRRE